MDSVIKTLRELHSFSQEELSQKLDISRQSLIKYESGRAELPLEIVRKLSMIFDVDYSCIIDNKMPVEPSYEIQKSRKNTDQCDIRISIPENNIEKFKQVFLYILAKVGARPNVGQTVLYKLLYFIDFDYYELYEKQLMGLSYIKNTYGPTPVDFAKLSRQMEKDGLIEEVKTEFYKHEMTNKDIPWIGAKEKQLLDYEAVFYRTPETSVRTYIEEND